MRMIPIVEAAAQRAVILLDNGFLTDIRTGAAGAIAAEEPVSTWKS